MSEQYPVRQWGTRAVATYLGVKHATVRSYLSRGQMPPPDGRIDDKPWWFEETITNWRQPTRESSRP